MGKHIEQTDLTRKSIVDAFWIIAEKSGVSKTSVSTVSKKAGINRSTFYEYFSDIDELILYAEDQILFSITEVIGALYIKHNLNCTHRDIAVALSPYYDKMGILLGKDGDRRFFNRIQSVAVELFSKIAENDDPMIEYEIVYIVSAFAGLLAYWNESGRKLTEDEFTELIHTMSIRGLSAQCTNAEMKQL